MHGGVDSPSRGTATTVHGLFVVLALIAPVRAVVEGARGAGTIGIVTAGLLAWYVLGTAIDALARPRPVPRSRGVTSWLIVLTALFAVLLMLSTDAVYLALPLCLLYLYLSPHWLSGTAVFTLTAVAAVVIGVRLGWSVWAVLGPFAGACFVVVVGIGHERMVRQAVTTARMDRELQDVRIQLEATGREAGRQAERARIARELHDTVAQGLASIQLLLHAAERAAPVDAELKHVRLARETASASLAQVRRFIAELAPPELDGDTIAAALRRLGEHQWSSAHLEVRVVVADALVVPMPVQTALLRIAQGAMGNVVQHARASRAELAVAADSTSVMMTVHDDGVGFDPAAPVAAPAEAGPGQHFGLRAMRERVEQLGGLLEVESAPGTGTTITVTLPLTSA